jgi:hypothetical protein
MCKKKNLFGKSLESVVKNIIMYAIMWQKENKLLLISHTTS